MEAFRPTLKKLLFYNPWEAISRTFVLFFAMAWFVMALAPLARANDKLSHAFLRICTDGLPDYAQAKERIQAAGFNLGMSNRTGMEFFDRASGIHGYVGTQAGHVFCRVRDPDASLADVNRISKRGIEFLFGANPKPWRYDGQIHAWTTPSPWHQNKNIHFGFDDLGDPNSPGGGTLHVYFRDR